MAAVQDIPLYRIVLTGGPCGGKTTALARVSSYLRQRGFEVFTVPEAFTILCSNGLTMDYFSTREGMDLIIQGTVLYRPSRASAISFFRLCKKAWNRSWPI